MKLLSNLIVNSLLLTVAQCGLIKRATGSINDFSKYPGISELINANKASFQTIFKDGPIYSGEGTAYGAATNGGNCLFPKDEYYKDMMYAALNRDQYLNDLGCGACALVVSTSNPYKPIRIRVIDQCPECKHGDLDFSDKAYKALTNQSPGRIKITWALIPCDIPVEEYPALVPKGSDIKFQFKTGSSATWTEVQVFNTRYPVAKFEAKVNGNYVALQRRDYNYWSNGAGLGNGPFDFRVTLADGSVVTATGVEFAIQGNDEDATFASGKQTVTGGTTSSGGSNLPAGPSNNISSNNNNNSNGNVGANVQQVPNVQAPKEVTPTTKTVPTVPVINNAPTKTVPNVTAPTNQQNQPTNNNPNTQSVPNTPSNNTPSVPNTPSNNAPSVPNTNDNKNNPWGKIWGNNDWFKGWGNNKEKIKILTHGDGEICGILVSLLHGVVIG
ncbi:carbohydrate-binding module family 63 protein [Piromyces sp. E2]|nr:carbohydrate-binding module family 63 protein [Piromyces sp. E2]|eukprot:OUM68648.1 carbohydrate-binding module family 63 protein [Piromyces sp. E2]